MYKIIFVDDEPLVLEGLSSIIDWNKYGIEVVGYAENAKDGINLVNEKKPDIIISDIRMQDMTGLEMIERLNEDGYNGYIIILSGYQEFEYARKAIEQKVYRYLLKPLDIVEIENTILNIVKELNSTSFEEPISEAMKEAVAYIKTHFCENIQLNDIAKKFHFEMTYFSKILKRELGMNFIDYITKLRMEKAKELLKKTKMSVDEIATHIGYKEGKYFRTTFKKYEGSTPREYRQNSEQ